MKIKSENQQVFILFFLFCFAINHIRLIDIANVSIAKHDTIDSFNKQKQYLSIKCFVLNLCH